MPTPSELGTEMATDFKAKTIQTTYSEPILPYSSQRAYANDAYK